jgi:hypothetical protein
MPVRKQLQKKWLQNLEDIRKTICSANPPNRYRKKILYQQQYLEKLQ